MDKKYIKNFPLNMTPQSSGYTIYEDGVTTYKITVGDLIYTKLNDKANINNPKFTGNVTLGDTSTNTPGGYLDMVVPVSQGNQFAEIPVMFFSGELDGDPIPQLVIGDEYANPKLQGIPTAPTITGTTDYSNKVATTAFVQNVIRSLNNLNGTNYVMVYGTGTPTENAAELQTAYDAAKKMPRYLGLLDTYQSGIFYKNQTYSTNDGELIYYKLINDVTGYIEFGDYEVISEQQAKSTRTTVIVAPGTYKFGDSITDKFAVNSSGINIVSLTGNEDVMLDGINVTANNIFLKGLNCGVNNFFIESNLDNLICEKCGGGDDSFGYTASGAFIIKGKFIKCFGGDRSWSNEGSIFSIECIDCTAGFYSFGTSLSSSISDFENCTLKNCGAKGGSFDMHGGALNSKYIG